MRLNDLLEKLPFLQRISSVLVCETDHLGLRAAVINRNGDELSIAHETSSEIKDLNSAVAEVVAYMRKQGWQGKSAVLLSPAVLLALIDLPIPHKNKLAPAQLSESISWEIEPLIAQHISTLVLGRLFVTLGYMTAEQVNDVVNQQSESNNTHIISPTETFTYKHFGEVAVELGYITQSQLQNGLNIQGWQKSSGDEIKCGWSAQGAKAVEDGDSDEALYKWLAAAVNQSLLRQWQAAFSAHGIKLEYLYPLTGCATGTLDIAHKNSKHQLLLEAHDSSIAGVHVSGHQVQNLHLQPNVLPDTLTHLTETYHLLESAEFDTIWFVDSTTQNEIEAAKLSSSLEHISQWPVKILPRPSHFVSLGMLSAARHVMNMKGSHLIAGVPVSNPKPSLLQRIEVRAVLAGLALLLIIGTAELILQLRKSLIEIENEKVSKELKVIDSAIGRVQAKVSEVKKLKENIKGLQTEVKDTESAVNLLSVDLPKRNQTIISLLNELSRSVSDDVVIDRIAEDPILGFTVNAWSLNEKAAQEFVKTYQVAIHPLGYKLKDVTVASQTGRLGLIGYSISFNATTLGDTKWNLIKQNVNSSVSSAIVNSSTNKSAGIK